MSNYNLLILYCTRILPDLYKIQQIAAVFSGIMVQKTSRGDPMAQKTKHSSSEIRIREAVRRVLSAGQVSSFAYPLPAEAGAQISMTGDPRAWGNRTRFSHETLKLALAALKPLSNAAEADLERYAERLRFFIQPGDCDRFVAAAALVAELTAAGFVKSSSRRIRLRNGMRLPPFSRWPRAGSGIFPRPSISPASSGLE